MKILRQVFMALTPLIMGVALMLPPIVVNATNSNKEIDKEVKTTNPVISIANPPVADVNAIGNYVNNVNKTLTDTNDITDFYFLKLKTKKATEGKTEVTKVVNIYVNMERYTDLNQKGKQAVMQTTLKILNDTNVCKISRTNRNKIYNNLCSMDESTSSLVRQLSDDVRADFYGAYATLRPFHSTVGWILGFLTLLIFIMLALMIIFDLAYMTVPMAQLTIDNMNTKIDKDGKNKKIYLVSIEAVNAVKQSESSVNTKDFKSPVSVYFSSKTKQIVLMSICVVYLVSGQIYDLIGRIMDYIGMIISL